MELKSLVDQLGSTQVRLQELHAEEAELKRQILARGVGNHVVGDFWEFTLVTIGPSAKVEWKAVALALQPPKRLVDKHTRNIEPYTQFRRFPLEV